MRIKCVTIGIRSAVKNTMTEMCIWSVVSGIRAGWFLYVYSTEYLTRMMHRDAMMINRALSK